MQLRRVFALLFAGLMGFSAGGVRAATLDIQSVVATRPGEKNAQIPESLAAYRGDLAMHTYGSFADGGKQTVELSASAPKTSVKVDKFTLDVTRAQNSEPGKFKISVTVKEGAKEVMTPLVYGFGKEKTKQLILQGKNGATIVFFTVAKEEQ